LAAAQTAGLDDGTIATLQARLRSLRADADWAVAEQGGGGAEAPAAGHGFEGAGKNQMTGTFFAAALAGWFGGSGETVQDRQLTAITNQTTVLNQILERLNRMEGAAFG
jgi:hypothetical protein